MSAQEAGDEEPYSPYKSPTSGRMLKLVKSAKSKTGYLSIIEPRPGNFSAKITLKPGVKKMSHLPGSSSTTPRGAAIHLARYRYSNPAPPRAPRGKVRPAFSLSVSCL